ncbi:zinc-ribbon domain-containing protein [Roseomonas marmotae]|uniref:Zinc-ribbon domain-containing protein n=1 Tax=Roseomonas marmotae TaxID=2768161 RepID=A0ABS3KDX3_9PROT|nr:zinc-ribbon domain-containing protein [Roseomonas marmotae]MBO1075671.1 zinc-ribbon domain-containing protein [Roseomonas marmotae]QTI79529.1 zinc-ribbon domain-containing protein [Roseomonas marmotae]
MRIECPACAAVYEVPDQLLAPKGLVAPRPVRCLRCGNEWQPAAAPEGSAPPAAPPPSAAPLPARSVPPPPRQPPIPREASLAREALLPRGAASPPAPLQAGHAPARATQGRGIVAPLLAWLLSLALLAAAALLLWRYRDAVVAAWPPAARLYGMLSL